MNTAGTKIMKGLLYRFRGERPRFDEGDLKMKQAFLEIAEAMKGSVQIYSQPEFDRK